MKFSVLIIQLLSIPFLVVRPQCMGRLGCLDENIDLHTIDDYIDQRINCLKTCQYRTQMLTVYMLMLFKSWADCPFDVSFIHSYKIRIKSLLDNRSFRVLEQLENFEPLDLDDDDDDDRQRIMGFGKGSLVDRHDFSRLIFKEDAGFRVEFSGLPDDVKLNFSKIDNAESCLKLADGYKITELVKPEFCDDYLKSSFEYIFFKMFCSNYGTVPNLKRKFIPTPIAQPKNKNDLELEEMKIVRGLAFEKENFGKKYRKVKEEEDSIMDMLIYASIIVLILTFFFY